MEKSTNKIMNQSEVRDFISKRGGNKEGAKDFWEGFANPNNKGKMYNDLTSLEENANQAVVTNFLRDRGGNRGIPQPTNINTIGSKNTVEKFAANPDGRYNTSKDSDSFYPGDKILTGNYFDGWNDTYFFNKSIFRDNLEFWQNPYKKN